MAALADAGDVDDQHWRAGDPPACADLLLDVEPVQADLLVQLFPLFSSPEQALRWLCWCCLCWCWIWFAPELPESSVSVHRCQTECFQTKAVRVSKLPVQPHEFGGEVCAS